MEKKQLAAVRDYNEGRFTKRVLFKNGESVVFVLHFMPGQELPPHQHPGTSVYILVLEGGGIVTVDGQETQLVQEDVICCEGHESFSFRSTEQTTLYVVLNRLPDERYAKEV